MPPKMNILFIGILFLLVINSSSAFSQKKSAYCISYPATFPQEVVSNLQSILGTITQTKWNAVEGQAIECGFYLTLTENDKYKTGESCHILSKHYGLIQFQSPTINGLIFGVYRYLRDLGCKFYLPDPLYTILPEKTDLFKKTDEMVTPQLRIRTIFGTGGFGSGKTDPDMSVKRDWQLWQWQNGFGAEFRLGGHVGETFNLNNAATLEKHPDWTVTPILKNGKVNKTAKLNYFNTDAVDFFTDWVIRKFTDKNYTPPPTFIRDMVSIDPADGGGYATGQAVINGTKINSVSDQVFYSANVAAQKLDKLFPKNPNIGVNLYAYSGHADIPNFKLNPRVFVQIVPYQFQNIAFGPAFIERWAEKVKRFGIRDYFKYPDSYHDLPGGYTLEQLMTRAMHAERAGSEGTTYETSYSKFATAVPLWVLIQFMADGKTDWQKEYQQLIHDLFGIAAAPIGKMFHLFYESSKFAGADLQEAQHYLEEARKSNLVSTISKRLDELALYLTYVKLELDSKNTQTGDMEQRLLPVYKMAWTLYESKIIDSYRLMQLVSYSFLNAKGFDAATTKKYKDLHLYLFPNSKNKDTYWKQPRSTAMYSSKELTSLYKNQSVASETIAMPTNTTALSTAEIIQKSGVNFKPIDQFRIRGGSATRGYFIFYAEKKSDIEIDYTLSNLNEAPSISISGTDESYQNIIDKVLNNKSGTYKITIPKGVTFLFVNASKNTTYQFDIQLKNIWTYFNPAPRGPMAFLAKDGTPSYLPSYYPTYFYVPKETTEIRLKVQKNRLTIYTPSGKKNTNSDLLGTMHGGWEIRSITVAPEDSGKFWQGIISGNYNYELQNIPNVWYLIQPK
ncbi:MAG: DUF4838 domain-containing protein [Chitinophagaceae bacterium]|nr:DUF4838 domain-containing protein [Chitinophagaceae bacterium]